MTRIYKGSACFHLIARPKIAQLCDGVSLKNDRASLSILLSLHGAPMAVRLKTHAIFLLVIMILDSPGAFEKPTLHYYTSFLEIPVTEIPDRIFTRTIPFVLI